MVYGILDYVHVMLQTLSFPKQTDFPSDDLKQVSQTVAGVDLSDHLVEVIFTLFDENSESLATKPLPCIYLIECGLVTCI